VGLLCLAACGAGVISIVDLIFFALLMAKNWKISDIFDIFKIGYFPYFINITLLRT